MLSDWKEVRTRLVVDRRRLTATLYRRGKAVFHAPRWAWACRAWPTPRSEFYIRNQLYGFGNPVYGPIAFRDGRALGGLTDWPGSGFIGLRGTNRPSLLPGRVSHGCIRLRNGDILRLARLMPVGAPDRALAFPPEQLRRGPMPSVSRITALFCGVAFGWLFSPVRKPQHGYKSGSRTSWAPPTPTEGATLRPGPATPLGSASPPSLRVAGRDDHDRCRRRPALEPRSRTTPGSPAAAGFLWVPEARERRPHVRADFLAQPDDQAVPSRTRRVDVHVVARGDPGSRSRAARRRRTAGRSSSVQVIARSAPSRSAAPVTRLRLLTPENTTNLVQAIEGGGPGRVWVRVRLPIAEQLDKLGAEANARQLADSANAPPRRSSPSHPDAVPDG